MSAGEVTFSADGALGWLTLSNPGKRNAISSAMWREIPRQLDAAAAAPGLRVLIVRGDGAAFAAGADISEFESIYRTPESSAKATDDVQRANEALDAFPLPVIAMIRGACVGGGCGLALCCDIRIAAEDARFGITPGKLGLAYTLADTKRLTDAVGFAAAKDILFSARLLDAGAALAAGLVNRVVADNQLEAETRAYAALIAGNSSSSLKTMKAIVRLIASGAVQENAVSQRLYAEAFASADFREGYRAFLEKRPPRFT